MSPDVGHYAFSALVLFMVYVFVVSIIEGLKKKFSWRWGIIVLLALVSFFKFGIDTGTFDFMWRKTVELFQAPPWSGDASQTNHLQNRPIS